MKYAIIFSLTSFCICANAAPALKKGGGNLIFQRSAKLEAWRAGAIKPVVLRQKFLESAYGFGSDWSFSRDGAKTTFAATPADVDFFNAGAYRSYLFTAYFNSHQKLQFAGYGRKSVENASYDYSEPSFDATGTKIVTAEGEVGQFAEDSSHRWLAIYDLKTRKRTFDSRKFVAALPDKKLKKTLGSQRFFAPSLAPNNRDLICFATFDDGDTYSDELLPGKTAPPTLLVHFDLKTQKTRILRTIQDQLSVGRLIFTSPNSSESTLPERTWPKTIAWHPSGQSFIFSAPKSANDALLNLFSCDLGSGKIARLTDDKSSDFCPQFSADGKSLFWIRGDATYDKTRENHLMRADSKGQNARAFLPQIKGVQHFQIVAQLAPWEKFSKIAIAPLAGRDK